VLELFVVVSAEAELEDVVVEDVVVEAVVEIEVTVKEPFLIYSNQGSYIMTG